MSILGVKKKQVDTTEIENKMARINIDLQTINTNDKELYKGINNVTLRVNNNEKMININKNKPDRTIICIYAGIDGIITKHQLFKFGDGGHSFLVPNSGQILSFNVISAARSTGFITFSLVLNSKRYFPGTTLKNKRSYYEFSTPILVEKGDTIGFISNDINDENLNTLASSIIELFI